MEGMFVHTDHVTLSENVPVDAVFTGWYRKDQPTFRVTARIIRVTDDGVALRFHNVDAAGYQALRTVLQQA